MRRSRLRSKVSQKTSDWGYTGMRKGKSRKNRPAATVSWGSGGTAKTTGEERGECFKPEQWKRHAGVRRAILAEAAYLK